MNRIKRLIVETHQRSLWQAVVVYLGASFGVLGGVDLFIEYLGLPRWLIWAAFSLLVVGLPVVVVISLAKEEVYGNEVPAEHAEAAAEEDRRLRFLTWRTAGLAFVGALAVWGLVLTAWVVLYPRTRPIVGEAIAEAPPGIAVLPFSVHGEGLDGWCEGLVDLLSPAMNGVGELRAIDSRTVLARWHEQVPETGEADRATALGVAQATGARYALLGSAVAIGPEVRLSADIYDIEGGAQMRTIQAEGSRDSVLTLANRLAVQSLVVVLGQEASEIPPIDLASLTTASVPALMEWWEAETLYRHGDVGGAVAAYERAVDLDSTFALAYYGLGYAYGWHGAHDRLDEAMEQALRWVDRLPAREAALVRATNAWPADFREAEEIFQRLVRTYPDYALGWFALGDMYYDGGTAIPVSVEEAERCFNRAVELDPQYATYRIHLIDRAFYIDPDSARVDSLIADYRRIASAEAGATRGMELTFDLAFGDQEHRERALASLDTLDSEGAMWAPLLLAHPRFWPQREAVWLALERRGMWQHASTRNLFGGATDRGYLGRALEYLDRPQASGFDRGCLPVWALMDGVQLPPEPLEEAAAVLSQIDSTSDPRLVYCAGFLAAAQGRWADHAGAVELAWDIWRREVDAGRLSWPAKADALALEAFGLWRQGDPEAAVAKLEEVRRYQATWYVRGVLGQVLVDLQRWEEAVPYLRRTMNPYTRYHLARAYEGMEEYGKAAKEYAYCVEAWEDADPELQPWVEDARRALERLAPDR